MPTTESGCRICATLVDVDTDRYPVEVLQFWKQEAEREAQEKVGRPRAEAQAVPINQLDRDLYAAFEAALPYEGSIRFVDQQNMAGFAFNPELLDDLHRFHNDWIDAAHEFIDPALEAKRRHLYSIAGAYLSLVATNTWPTGTGLQSVPPEWEETDPTHFYQLVANLHTLAGGIVEAHQQLTRAARRRLHPR